ncbi:MAG: hypothetical protein ACOWWR_05400 [Eubacteriales bacterium]
MREWWFSQIVITNGECIIAILALIFVGIIGVIFEYLWLKELKKRNTTSSKDKENP